MGKTAPRRAMVAVRFSNVARLVELTTRIAHVGNSDGLGVGYG